MTKSLEGLFQKILDHPEVEIRRNDGTSKLLEWVLDDCEVEMDQNLSIGSLMRLQYKLMVKLTENADERDRDWFAPTLAKLAGWEQPERFLSETGRSTGEYLDWSYIPNNHPLRAGHNTGTVRKLFFDHPYAIIAPTLRTVRNTRH